MHSKTDTQSGSQPPSSPNWDWIIGQLLLELPQIVEDFLEELALQEPYPEGQVAQQDIVDTATQNFDLLIRRLRGEPDPPAAAGLIERLAARRAQQGVPLETFLQAARLDFRVLWLHMQRIAGKEGSAVLAENVIHLLSTVDDYIDALRHAYRAEEDRIDRTYASQRHRVILRLFSGEDLTTSDVELIATRLRMRASATYEVVAVTGEAIDEMLARYQNKTGVGMFESVSTLVLFREQTAPEQWRREVPAIGGYIGGVAGLAAVPHAARVAIEIAKHAPATPLTLATEVEVWATVARQQLSQVFPGFVDSIETSLRELPEHESARLVEAVQAYFRTGSIKDTAEALFCHRNTVINRLRSFAETCGYDPTIPQDAAWIHVALAPQPSD